MALIETRNVPTWNGKEVQQAQSCADAANTTVTAVPSGAKRVVFSALSATATHFLSIHNNASATAHEGVLIGGADSIPAEFILDTVNPATFYAYNASGAAVVLGAVYYFQ